MPEKVPDRMLQFLVEDLDNDEFEAQVKRAKRQADTALREIEEAEDSDELTQGAMDLWIASARLFVLSEAMTYRDDDGFHGMPEVRFKSK